MCQITQMDKKLPAKIKGNFLLIQHKIIMFTYRLLNCLSLVISSVKIRINPYFNPNYESCGHYSMYTQIPVFSNSCTVYICRFLIKCKGKEVTAD